MYTIDIITKYNEIHLEVEDIFTEQVKEILSQPYIIEVAIHKQKNYVRIREKPNGKGTEVK